MAMLNREQFFQSLQARVGEDKSDETMKFMEDVTDTYTQLETLATGMEDWKNKYEENDNTWRDKYKERFFGNDEDNNAGMTTPMQALNGQNEDNKKDTTPRTFDELFTQRGV